MRFIFTVVTKSYVAFNSFSMYITCFLFRRAVFASVSGVNKYISVTSLANEYDQNTCVFFLLSLRYQEVVFLLKLYIDICYKI